MPVHRTGGNVYSYRIFHGGVTKSYTGAGANVADTGYALQGQRLGSVSRTYTPPPLPDGRLFNSPWEKLDVEKQILAQRTVQYNHRPLHRLADGRRYAIIHDNTNNVIYAYQLQDAITSSVWVEQDSANRPVAGAGNSITGVSSVLDASGLIHVVTQRNGTNNDVRYYTFNPATNTWSAPETVATDGFDAFVNKASISVDTSGKPHVAYGGNVGGNPRILYRNRISGSWSAAEQVNGNVNSNSSAIHIDGNDDARFVWFESTTAKYRRRANGGAYDAEQTIVSGIAGTNNGYPMFAVRDNGDVVFTYWTTPGTTPWLIWAVLRPSSTGIWNSPILIMTDDWSGSVEWSHDVMHTGTDWVIIFVHDTSKLFISQSANAVTWTTPKQYGTTLWRYARLINGRYEQIADVHRAEAIVERESTTETWWLSIEIEVNLAQTVTVSAISSAEAFGTLAVVAAQFVSPSAIGSAEVIGTSKVNLRIFPSTIASSEAFGTANINFLLSPVAIASTEAFGASKLNLRISPVAITSSEAFGTYKINFRLLLTQIASSEAFGTPFLTSPQYVIPSGIASAEAIGTARVNFRLLPSAISSAELFGSHKTNFRIFTVAISSTEIFGTLKLNLRLLLTAISSAESFGSLNISLGTVFVLPNGIAMAEAFGTSKINLILRLNAITSAEVFGTLKVNLRIFSVAINSGEVLGSPIVSLAVLVIQPMTIASSEAFGTLKVNFRIFPITVASGEVFGTLTISSSIPAVIAVTIHMFSGRLTNVLQNAKIVIRAQSGRLVARLMPVKATVSITSGKINIIRRGK